jgi:hypothetical protein
MEIGKFIMINTVELINKITLDTKQRIEKIVKSDEFNEIAEVRTHEENLDNGHAITFYISSIVSHKYLVFTYSVRQEIMENKIFVTTRYSKQDTSQITDFGSFDVTEKNIKEKMLIEIEFDFLAKLTNAKDDFEKLSS